MGGIDDHVAVMGNRMPPDPNPVPFILPMMNNDAAAGSNLESDCGNISVKGPEQECDSINADQKGRTESNFRDNETGGPKFSSGGLMERIAARAAFNAPRLNTESIRPADLSKKPDVRSPYLTIPSGLSPTTFLDSTVFLSNSLVPPSPTTGKFSFASSGETPLTTHDSDKGKDNNFEEINASSFAFKPITESASFPYSAATNKSFPSAGFTVHSNTSLPCRSMEPTKAHLTSNRTLFQDASLSKPDFGNNCISNLLQQTHNSVVAAENSSPFDEQNDDGDQMSNGDPYGVGNTAEDAYSWRKYGQKHVKGSEYPRSYYKCTHPNCPVKKKVERSQEGHITEIIYKGAHIHPMPPPNRISTLGPSNLDSEQPANGGGTSLQAQNGTQFESGDGVDGSSTFSNDEEDPATHCSASLGYDGEGDNSESKRRRIEAYAPEMSGAARPLREPRVVVQTTSEIDILDDGYRWRKYGRKFVKGNPNPRSYYKCTSTRCNVRKHVERASHDLKSVITTYEGKHNHDVPAARSSNIQRTEPPQIRGSTTWFERPPLGSFGRPQLGPGPGFGYEMNQRGLARLGFAGIGHNQGKLAALPLPNHQYLGHRVDNTGGYMLPKGEPKIESVTDAGLNSSNGSAAYEKTASWTTDINFCFHCRRK